MSQFIALTVCRFGRGLFNVDDISTVNTPAQDYVRLHKLQGTQSVICMRGDNADFNVEESVAAIGTALNFLKENPTAGIAIAAHYMKDAP